MASDAENASIWWRHHDIYAFVAVSALRNNFTHQPTACWHKVPLLWESLPANNKETNGLPTFRPLPSIVCSIAVTRYELRNTCMVNVVMAESTWWFLMTWRLFQPSWCSTAYVRQWSRWAFVQIMACSLFGTKPLSEPVLGYCQLDL